MKTTNFALAKSTDHFPAVGGSKGVSCVIYHLEPTLATYPFDGFRITRPTPNMYADDSGCTRGDETFNTFGIDII